MPFSRCEPPCSKICLSALDESTITQPYICGHISRTIKKVVFPPQPVIWSWHSHGPSWIGEILGVTMVKPSVRVHQVHALACGPIALFASRSEPALISLASFGLLRCRHLRAVLLLLCQPPPERLAPSDACASSPSCVASTRNALQPTRSSG